VSLFLLFELLLEVIQLGLLLADLYMIVFECSFDFLNPAIELIGLSSFMLEFFDMLLFQPVGFLVEV